MREIKFRYWDDEYKEMEYDIGNEVALQHGILTDIYGKSILMQFTGLKDKNDKEIYEGDIVKNVDIVGNIVFEKGVFIIASNDYADSYEPLFGFANSESWCENVEVIGNIYENGDLLNGK